MNNAPQALTLCDYVAMALFALVAGVELWKMCFAVIDRRRAARAASAAAAKDGTKGTEALLDKLEGVQATDL